MPIIERTGGEVIVLGVAVRLDHIFFPLPLIDIREQLVSLTEFLPEVPEPFGIGRHVWLVDDKGVEWHFLKPDGSEAPVTQRIHLGLRPRTEADFLEIRRRAEAQGIEIVEADRRRNDQIERFYLVYELDGRTAVTEIVGKFDLMTA